MRPLDSIVYRRQVGERLRRLREAAGKTQAHVMEEMDWSRSKINRIESGAVGIGRPDLMELLRIYEVTDESEIAALIADGSAGRRHSTLAQFRPHLSPDFYTYLGYEESAKVYRSFQPLALHGLLQVDGYSTAVTGWRGRKSAEFVQAMVSLRARRQELLSAGDGPSFSFLISETVVRLRVGSDRVMRAQIKRLMTVARQPNVTLRIVPFEYGLHRRWREPYVVLEVGERAPQVPEEIVLFLETPRGDYLFTESANTAPRPSDWLADHDALEERVGGLDATMARLEAALARFSSS